MSVMKSKKITGHILRTEEVNTSNLGKKYKSITLKTDDGEEVVLTNVNVSGEINRMLRFGNLVTLFYVNAGIGNEVIGCVQGTKSIIDSSISQVILKITGGLFLLSFMIVTMLMMWMNANVITILLELVVGASCLIFASNWFMLRNAIKETMMTFEKDVPSHLM
ncbi:hypothetical protein ACTOI6_18865 (plasmid) [Komagataeibacter intermedius]|uniref:hypothetical protein n=1 Tax=Komagataeibacter intermedius TaxID=66229 RepID=UPI0040362F70